MDIVSGIYWNTLDCMHIIHTLHVQQLHCCLHLYVLILCALHSVIMAVLQEILSFIIGHGRGHYK